MQFICSLNRFHKTSYLGAHEDNFSCPLGPNPIKERLRQLHVTIPFPHVTKPGNQHAEVSEGDGRRRGHAERDRELDALQRNDGLHVGLRILRHGLQYRQEPHRRCLRPAPHLLVIQQVLLREAVQYYAGLLHHRSDRILWEAFRREIFSELGQDRTRLFDALGQLVRTCQGTRGNIEDGELVLEGPGEFEDLFRENVQACKIAKHQRTLGCRLK
mmetsp:Transcript_45748/g.97263  ORF Transcript_45748/g.97263 Transcript_45748/m.97263 type:complete len:215 (+) Transcript_45748:1347-1991(+)